MKKLIFIIYTAVIVATGLCALVFKEHLNIGIASIYPIASILLMVFLGWVIHTGHISSSGRICIKKRDVSKSNVICGYVLYICAIAPIPLVFFFDVYVKLLSFFTFLVPSFIGLIIDVYFLVKEKRAIKVKRDARRQKLEEQKKREEMGRWK